MEALAPSVRFFAIGTTLSEKDLELSGSVATNIVEMISKKRNIKKVNIRLQIDNFLSEQLLTLASRAENEHDLAESWDLDFLSGVALACAVPNLAKIGITFVASAKSAAVLGSNAAKASAAAGLGIILAAAMIPIDVAQLVSNSIKVGKGTPSGLVKEIRLNG